MKKLNIEVINTISPEDLNGINAIITAVNAINFGELELEYEEKFGILFDLTIVIRRILKELNSRITYVGSDDKLELLSSAVVSVLTISEVKTHRG